MKSLSPRYAIRLATAKSPFAVGTSVVGGPLKMPFGNGDPAPAPAVSRTLLGLNLPFDDGFPFPGFPCSDLQKPFDDGFPRPGLA